MYTVFEKRLSIAILHIFPLSGHLLCCIFWLRKDSLYSVASSVTSQYLIYYWSMACHIVDMSNWGSPRGPHASHLCCHESCTCLQCPLCGAAGVLAKGCMWPKGCVFDMPSVEYSTVVLTTQPGCTTWYREDTSAPSPFPDYLDVNSLQKYKIINLSCF